MKTNPGAKPLTQLGGMARQGDTLLRRVKSVPSNQKRLHKSLPTLALGEKSGHHHSFTQGGATAFADDEGAILADHITVTAPEAPLTHQEHSTIVFPQGDYESLKQVEDSGDEVVAVRD